MKVCQGRGKLPSELDRDIQWKHRRSRVGKLLNAPSVEVHGPAVGHHHVDALHGMNDAQSLDDVGVRVEVTHEAHLLVDGIKAAYGLHGGFHDGLHCDHAMFGVLGRIHDTESALTKLPRQTVLADASHQTRVVRRRLHHRRVLCHLGQVYEGVAWQMPHLLLPRKLHLSPRHLLDLSPRFDCDLFFPFYHLLAKILCPELHSVHRATQPLQL
mmetsp:Transcript_50742/g.142068  ORF Transcript_50742/g.142068 Transcript_50742/m.142068 type:complete len:213 (+) Transcript_50742:265-903(+)